MPQRCILGKNPPVKLSQLTFQPPLPGIHVDNSSIMSGPYCMIANYPQDYTTHLHTLPHSPPCQTDLHTHQHCAEQKDTTLQDVGQGQSEYANVLCREAALVLSQFR